MTISKAQVLDGLRRIKGPDLKGNIVDLGLVSEVLIKDEKVYFAITVPASRADELEPLRQAAEKVVGDIGGVKSVAAVLTAEAAGGRVTNGGGMHPHAHIHEHPRVVEARARGSTSAPAPAKPAAQVQQKATPVAGVQHLIAVASGKGGVGKSTVAVNLALGLVANGLKAGILDADIYGPSQPRLLGLKGRPEVAHGRVLRPMQAHGLRAMSMGFMVEEGTPVVWRGPMVVQALNQMLREVEWGDLDVLVIDMPPGTGDVQLTIAQQVPLAGAVIVSTPQDLALIDARKGLAMFGKVDVPILGIVENMSTFICPKCGERSDIFGHGGAEAEARKLGVPFLGGVPLHMDIRETSDSGTPVTATAPDGPHAAIFRDIATGVWSAIAEAGASQVAPPALDLNTTRDRLHVTFEKQPPIVLPAELLRVMSPSAEVQGHSSEQRVTVAGKRHVKITDLKPVGNYAVRIVFDDGHDTGLYTWRYLAELGRDKEKRWNQHLDELAAKGLSRE